MARPNSSGRPDASPFQNGILPGWPGAGETMHLVVGDVLDAPGRGAEQEGLADAALEDHLLVELADAGGPRRRAGEEDAVEAAIGDGAAVGDGDALGALAADDRVAHAIPGDARPQLGELVGRVAAGQHVEHALEDAAIEVGEGRGPPHHREQLVDRPAVHRHGGDDLLRQHVERIARIARRLDQALVHAARRGGAGDEIAAVLREDQAFAHGADLVAGPADALQPARHRRRRLDLHDQVDRAHVDAELERRRRDQAAQPAFLQRVLDVDPLRAGQRSVVRAHQRLAGELVQRGGEAFGDAAAVDEDQRRRCATHQRQQARMDRGPDRRAGRALRGGAARDVDRLGEPRHVLDRHFDLQPQRLAPAGVDDRDRARRRRGGVRAGELVGDLARGILRAMARGLTTAAVRCRSLPPPEIQRDFLERPLRGRQPDALQRTIGQRVEPLHRQREMRAALGRDERVDLVDDQRVDAAERLAGVRGQEEIQRLRRRDDDVGRFAQEAGAFARRRVAGADEETRDVHDLAAAPGGGRDSHDRRAQVALDVHGERLQRRDVDDPAAPPGLGRRREHHAVQAPEERGQRLAAARRGEEQRRLAAADRRPALGLGRGRPLERGAEPVPDGGMKRRKRHPGILAASHRRWMV